MGAVGEGKKKGAVSLDSQLLQGARRELEGTRWQDLLSWALRACGEEGEAQELGHNEIGKCLSFCGQKHWGCWCFIQEISTWLQPLWKASCSFHLSLLSFLFCFVTCSPTMLPQ